MSNSIIFRWCFEIATLLGVVTFFIFQIGNEIKNAGPSTCWRFAKISM